ncbi:MAG: protein kinase [Rubrivivax sp.]|nr:protein kinase [Pyrinomonadaceae bacterium]
MTPERWRQVYELFEATLRRAPEERAAYLEAACDGDAELRSEVLSLLEAHDQPDNLIDESLSKLAAQMSEDDDEPPPLSLAGRTLGFYRVARELGRGGMGEVYLARDTRLDRPVALKLLSASFTRDPDRVNRFRREARAVSLLNHPNILTVYEVGESEGFQFIVTEHVEGRTLREAMSRERLTPARALDIAAQAASALAAAHEAGIIHRDVKPENLMIRPDGYVKVLDFGLAKLTGLRIEETRPASTSASDDETSLGSQNPQSAIRNPQSTMPGLVMGTVSYMSPEQARGQKVDARTDVWSLAVVLYELLAGRAPFEGETRSDVLVSILTKEPEPLAAHAPNAPEELRRVVSKALCKEREERYPSMREMLADLREAREEVAFRSRQELHLSTGGTGHAGVAEGRTGRRRSRMLVWAALSVVVASALAFGAYEYIRSRRASPLPPPTPKLERITAHGKIWGVAITRDGKHIAYAAGPERQQGLWVMQAGTGSSVQIVPPAEGVAYWGLTFSPEADYVYYVRNEGAGLWELYRVPTFGGTPKRLVVNIDSAVAFSPDGRQMAFGRIAQGNEITQLVVANTDGTGERVVATRKTPDFFNLQLVVKIAWSPDGETIACPAGNSEATDAYIFEVVAVSLKDGTERPLTRRKWTALQQVAWLSDGSGLVMIARDEPSAHLQVWHVSYPEGDARRLTDDFNHYNDLTVTADSRSLLTIQTDWLSNVWVAPEADAARARRITDGRNEGFHGLSWTPDGRVVFGSRVGGNVDIWVMDADGGNRRRLTDYADWDAHPSVSPDGRYIVFESRRAGGWNIWRMDADGGNPVQLTRGLFGFDPQCSPDGRWVYYSAITPGKNYRTAWKVPVEGGEPVQVSDKQGLRPSVSPDQKWVAYQHSDLRANPPHGVAVAPVEGVPIVRMLAIPHETRIFGWTPDGRALAYIDPRSPNVWAVPTDGGKPRQLTDFKSDQTFWFAWSRDGKRLALARGTRTSDVALITNFR